MNYFLVFLGGGLGAMARFFTVSFLGHNINHAALPLVIKNLPVGTLLVNWLGAFIIGLVVEFFALKFYGNHELGNMLRYFLVVGILGGFTTFSAVSLETYLLFLRGEYILAIIYILLSILGTILLVLAGTMLARSLF
ncbi:MAG: fluoride efflux transporter FluC [Alphaproteobacteria bacterium]